MTGRAMRPEDWERRLLDFVEARRTVPFVWGTNDCALFAADWVAALTGEDPAAWFRGRYTTEGGAARALLAWCKGQGLDLRLAGSAGERFTARLEAVATDILGAPLNTPLLAQRGDVVSRDGDDGLGCLGVVLGALAAFPRRVPGGVVRAPVMGCRTAWAVAR